MGRKKRVSLRKTNGLLWKIRSFVIMFIYVSDVVFFKAMKLPREGIHSSFNIQSFCF